MKIQEELRSLAMNDKKYREVFNRAATVIDEMENINNEMLSIILAENKRIRDMENMSKVNRMPLSCK